MNGGLACKHCDETALDNAELVAHLATEHDIEVDGRTARREHAR